MRLKCLPLLPILWMVLGLQSCREASSSTPAPSAQQTTPSAAKDLPAAPSDAAAGEKSMVSEEHRSKRRRQQSGDRNAPRGVAGDFDFYVLSLSWSPQHCSTPAGEHDRDQCAGAKHYNFVVHGLWPQYDPRGWPQSCGGEPRVSGSLLTAMLPLMPSPKLINHEWEKHGTCSGLGQQGYFEKVKQARAKVNIPAEFQSPNDAVRTTASAIKAKFVAANPGMTPNSMGVTCSGRFLQEVDLCLTKDLNLRACGSGVRQN